MMAACLVLPLHISDQIIINGETMKL